MSNTSSANEQWKELAASIGYTTELAMWEQLYVVEERGIGELAKTLGFGTATVQRRIKLANVERRTRGGAHSISRVYDRYFHLDQRFVALASGEEIATLCGASPHTIYRLRRKCENEG